LVLTVIVLTEIKTRHFIDKHDYKTKIILSLDSDWENFYPSMKCNIITNPSLFEKLFENVWENQKILTRKYGSGTNGLLLVVDDWIIPKTKHIINDILMNSRYFNTTIVIGMSYPSSICPSLRTCFDYVFMCRENNVSNLFMCRENNVSNLKLFFNQYGGMFPDFHTFIGTTNILTKNYASMVINQRTIGSA
jgi:hypothetical protein